MNCPICEAKSKVIDSRMTTKKTRRRRICLECDYRFTTYELDKESFYEIMDYIEDMQKQFNNMLETSLKDLERRKL